MTRSMIEYEYSYQKAEGLYSKNISISRSFIYLTIYSLDPDL